MAEAQITREELDARFDAIKSKIDGLKAWGVAALVGGQALAGLVATMVGSSPTAPLRAALRAVGLV